MPSGTVTGSSISPPASGGRSAERRDGQQHERARLRHDGKVDGLLLADAHEALESRFFADGAEGSQSIFSLPEYLDVVLARQRIRDDELLNQSVAGVVGVGDFF